MVFRKDKKFQRVLSILLSLYLIVGMLPMAVAAQDVVYPSEKPISGNPYTPKYGGGDYEEEEICEEEGYDEYYTEEPEAEAETMQGNPEQLISPASAVIVMDEAELVTEISAGTAVITLGTDIYISGDNLVIPTGADIRLEGNSS